MPHIRVSCNDGQYKQGFEQLLVAQGLYAAWLGDSANGLGEEWYKESLLAPFGGRGGVALHRRAFHAYKNIHVGDTFVMAGVTGFYVGLVTADPEEEIVADNTGAGSSVRARVHAFARKCQQRNMVQRGALAAAEGLPAEVYEVRFRVAWEKIEPTAEQLAWAKGVQGTFVHRTIPFPVAGPAAEAADAEVPLVAEPLLMPAEPDLRALLAARDAELAALRAELATLRRFRDTVAAALPA